MGRIEGWGWGPGGKGEIYIVQERWGGKHLLSLPFSSHQNKAVKVSRLSKGKTTSLVLSGCFWPLRLQARYCSSDCQEGDWARHRDYCRVVREKREQRNWSKEQVDWRAAYPLNRSYYPHQSRDSLSPVCGILAAGMSYIEYFEVGYMYNILRQCIAITPLTKYTRP